MFGGELTRTTFAFSAASPGFPRPGSDFVRPWKAGLRKTQRQCALTRHQSEQFVGGGFGEGRIIDVLIEFNQRDVSVSGSQTFE